jgi:spermidine/putrescine transport system permease protein
MLKKLTSGPYMVWSLLFIIVPIVLVGTFSFVEDGSFSFANYSRFLEPIYLKVLGRSVKIAIEATIVCLFIGYPLALILAKMKSKYRTIAVMLLVVPMWMNFLLRTYAWLTILNKNGVLNHILGLFGVEPMSFLYTEGAVLVVMVYNFLPFMVLPIYTVLTKMDKSLVEAAEDLGANKGQVFYKITLPLSLSGVLSGISMVFMPAVSTFVISNLLYGGQYMLIGNLIEQQFLTVNNWQFGSAISILLMIMILISMAVMNKLGDDGIEQGGGNLW